MKDLCISVPYLKEDQIAEVELTFGTRKIQYSFRVESFPWEVEDDLSNPSDDAITRSLKRITRLKNAIKSYDKDWEVIQIFNPSENASNIQVLYRKKIKQA